MVAVPALIPVTFPDASTVATPTLPLLHTPDAVASVSVVTAPIQILEVPPIGVTVGSVRIVTTVLAEVTTQGPWVTRTS